MTAAAKALIRRYYAAFNTGDTAGVLACLADDAQLDLNQGDTRHGKPAFVAFYDGLDRCLTKRLGANRCRSSRNTAYRRFQS